MISRRKFLLASGGAALIGGSTYVGISRMLAMDDYTAYVDAIRRPLKANPAVDELIRYATLAANSHNTQPWRFRMTTRGVDILPDTTRKLSAVDPDDHHLFASLGCAAENLAIAAAMRNMPGALTFSSDDGGAIHFEKGGNAHAEPSLFAAIPKRQSTRGDYNGASVSVADLATLTDAAATPGVDEVFITDRPTLNQLRDLVIAGNSEQMADAAFIRELKTWLRFSSTHARQTGDGLFSATTGNPVVPEWLGSTMFSLFFKTKSENAKYTRHIATSVGIAVFVAQGEGPQHWVQAGRACQRFALAATALGLKHAFMNQPVEVPRLRPELAALMGMPGRRPDIVMRFGYGKALPYSARRSVSSVLV